MKVFVVGSVSSSVFGFRRDLLSAMAKKGHEVTVYVFDAPPSLVLRANAELGVTVRNYPLSRSGINPFYDLFTLFFLFREMRRDKPNVVLSYFSKPVIWATLAAFFSRVKGRYGILEGLGFFFINGGDDLSLKYKMIRRVQVLLFHISLPLLSKVIFLNDDDRNEIVRDIGVKVKDSFVLGGIGVDLDEFSFSDPPTDGLHFIFVGRLLKEKGLNEFLEAAKVIKSICPEATFSVCGSIDRDNPGAVDLGDLDFLEGQSIVKYLGQVSDVASKLSASSVFVLPSYREGVPRSTQEAMAIGRAVITTDVPGCRDTVTDGVNGYLVPPRDVKALSEAMMRFVNDPALVHVMGVQSRIIAEDKFDVHKVNSRLLKAVAL